MENKKFNIACVVGSLVTVDTAQIVYKHYLADKSVKTYGPVSCHAVTSDDTLSGKYLGMMAQVLASTDENAPFKFPVADAVYPYFCELLKVVHWCLSPGKGHTNEPLFEMLQNGYYKRHWVQNPSSEAQIQFVEDFSEKYLNDDYILAGLDKNSARTKKNVIIAIKNQVPRIFHASRPETINRLQELVEIFLDYYIKDETAEKYLKRRVQIVSIFGTQFNTLKLEAKEKASIVKAIEAGKNVSVTFDRKEDYSLRGAVKVGRKKINVSITPPFMPQNYLGRTSFDVSVKKRWNYNVLVIPITYAVYNKKSEEYEYLTKEATAAALKSGDYLISIENKVGILIAGLCKQWLDYINADSVVESERRQFMNELTDDISDIEEYLS